jgi:hypothetical protein
MRTLSESEIYHIVMAITSNRTFCDGRHIETAPMMPGRFPRRAPLCNCDRIGAVGRRHEIDHRCRAGLGLEFGFGDQRAGTITPCRPDGRILWSYQPAPLSAFPSKAAKQAAESKRGQHSQSIEPSRPTKAVVLQSPIRA